MIINRRIDSIHDKLNSVLYTEASTQIEQIEDIVTRLTNAININTERSQTNSSHIKDKNDTETNHHDETNHQDETNQQDVTVVHETEVNVAPGAAQHQPQRDEMSDINNYRQDRIATNWRTQFSSKTTLWPRHAYNAR